MTEICANCDYLKKYPCTGTPYCSRSKIPTEIIDINAPCQTGVCASCHSSELVPMKTMEDYSDEYLICHKCCAVFREGNLFGFYERPVGSLVHGDALEQAADGTTVPRMKFCPETMLAAGKLLNCVLDHDGCGRVHQSRITISGVWIEITWDYGNKKVK